jgi:hypothetical protein
MELSDLGRIPVQVVQQPFNTMQAHRSLSYSSREHQRPSRDDEDIRVSACVSNPADDRCQTRMHLPAG